MASRQHPASSTAQLIKRTVNGFRYQVAVITKGRAVFAQVVEWLYQGGPCIKTYFLSLGYTDTDYKRKFNNEQRALLEKKAPFREFDISFLYVILQLLCGLAAPNNPAWTSPQKGQPLEHLLYKIKQKRNHFAHSNDVQQMSDQKLIKEFRKLKCLFSRIIRRAGCQSGIRPDVYRDEVSEIKVDFQDLLQKVREPLQGSDLSLLPQLQQKIKVFKEKLQRQLEDDCQRELHSLYSSQWDVTLAQWPYPRAGFSKQPVSYKAEDVVTALLHRTLRTPYYIVNPPYSKNNYDVVSTLSGPCLHCKLIPLTTKRGQTGSRLTNQQSAC